MKNILSLVMLASIAVSLSGCGGLINKQAKYEEREQTYGNMALYYLAHNNLTQAENYLNKASKEKMHSLKLMHANALLSARKGNLDKAHNDFSKAISMADEKNMQIKNMILRDYASFLCANNGAEKGLALLAQLNNAQNMQEQIVMGQCSAASGALEKAQLHFRNSLDIAESPQALLALADIAYRQDKYLQAKAFLERYFLTGALSDFALQIAVDVETHLKNTNKQAYYESMLANLKSSDNVL